jgi:small subunit ribosomal protein S21
MIKIKIDKDGLNKALKTLKTKVIKTKQNQNLIERKEFVKKSVIKRNQKLKATYIQKIKSKLD